MAVLQYSLLIDGQFQPVACFGVIAGLQLPFGIKCGGCLFLAFIPVIASVVLMSLRSSETTLKLDSNFRY